MIIGNSFLDQFIHAQCGSFKGRKLDRFLPKHLLVDNGDDQVLPLFRVIENKEGRIISSRDGPRVSAGILGLLGVLA